MKKIKNFFIQTFVFILMLFCISYVTFCVVSCEKEKKLTSFKYEIGTSQSPISFKFLNNNYKDCAINPVGLSPRLEWDVWDLNINYFRFVSSDTIIYWQNCNITNCEGAHVIPTVKKPLTQKYFLYQHQIPNGEKVTLEYYSKSYCAYDSTGVWIKYPANEVTIRY